MLSEKYVKSLAKYSRIALKDVELAEITRDLNGTIELLKPLQDYDLDGVEVTTHPIGTLSNVMREDVAKKRYDVEALLSNASTTEGSYYKIPAILSEEESS